VICTICRDIHRIATDSSSGPSGKRRAKERGSPENFRRDLPLVCMTPAILALLIFLMAPCFAADSKTAVAKAPAQNFSAQQDKAAEAAIRAKLAKSKVGADGFTVRVQGGIAYWEGTTTVPQHKGAATRMAHAAGVPSVINNIKVSKTGASPSAPRATSSTPAKASGAAPAAAQTAPATSPAAPAAPPDAGLRRAQVKPASTQNGPPQ
jgi:hypothetical protein